LSAKRKKKLVAVIPEVSSLAALVEVRDDDSDLAEENE
jgi:hypothetical protein